MPATPRETSAVEHEIRIAARPETIFAYFTDPARLVQWMGAEATLDPRPGGICRIVFDPPPSVVESLTAALGGEAGQGTEPAASEGPRVMMGRFVEVEPHLRIGFTWGWEQDLYSMPPQSTAVSVSLTPEGSETVVRLIHRQLPSAAVPLHRAGWGHYLPRLAILAEDGNPGPDPWQATAG
jgi:uncharacterized protein YndB with AHSA1/START domain